MSRRDIEVTIDRLVLHGGAGGATSPQQLAEAVELELARLLSTEGLPGSLSSGAAVPPRSGRILSPASPPALSGVVARVVYESLRGQPLPGSRR